MVRRTSPESTADLTTPGHWSFVMRSAISQAKLS
jgi:hypothetical protein